MKLNDQVKVWSIFIRLFHWALVVLFVMEFIIEDDLIKLHTTIGYVIISLLVLRILYGFVGDRYARFSDFIYAPGTVLNYTKSVFTFSARRYIGHNPAGGIMIILMIIVLISTVVTGVLTLPYADQPREYFPIIGLLPYWVFSSAEDFHEVLADISLFLVVIHLTGVLVESVLHEENLIGSMLSGRKKTNISE